MASFAASPDPSAFMRYAPQEPFPPYSYVPGLWPHPHSHPSGHAYQHHPPEAPPLEEATWRTNLPYLLGFDYWNAGYYWEAHETWEAVWKATKLQQASNTSSPIDHVALVQGLIKLAAVGVKIRESNLAGVQRHATRAHELLTIALSSLPAPHTSILCGLDLPSLIRQEMHLAQNATQPQTIVASPPLVVVVFPWKITLHGFVKENSL